MRQDVSTSTHNLTSTLLDHGVYSADAGASTGAPIGTPARGNTVEFLALLYRDVPSGWLEITYLAPDGANVDRITHHDPEGKRHRAKTVVDWRPLPLGKVDPRMKRLHDLNRRGYSVHFGVAIRRERKQGEWRTHKDTNERYWMEYPRGTQADALYIPALWAEADAKDFGGDLEAARQAIEALDPSILIFSGAGYHGYWLLDELLEVTDDNRADIKRTLRGLAKAAEGDSSVADLARIMRLPGFANTKPGRNGALCEVIYAHETRFSFGDLFTTYAPLIPVALKRNAPSTYTADSDQEAEVIEALRHISADSISYGDWITILAALRSSFDEATATAIAEQWSGTYSKPGEIAAKMATFDNGYSGAPATLGSLFHMAKQFGYTRPNNARNSPPVLRVVKRTAAPNLAETSPYYYREGFAVEQYEAVFAALPGNDSAHKLFMLVYEALRQHLIDPHDFTIKHLISARDTLGIKLPDSSLKRVMGRFWELISHLHIEGNSMANGEIKSQRGHPEQHFAMLPREDMERNLLQWAEHRIEEKRHQKRGTTPPLTSEMIDSLDGDARKAALEVAPHLTPTEETRKSAWLARRDFSTLARSLKTPHFAVIPLDCEDVRAAVFAATVDEGEAIPQSEIERRFGISRAPVLVKRAGYCAEVQTVDCPITSETTFEREVYEARKKHRGFPRALVEVKPSGELVEHDYMVFDPQKCKKIIDPERNKQIIRAAQQAGSTVRLKLQTAHKYHKVDPTAQPLASDPHPAFRASVRDQEPTSIRLYYGTGYNPSIVRHWLKSHLHKRGWKQMEESGKWINPANGEMYDLREQTFLEFAESLGAVITELSA